MWAYLWWVVVCAGAAAELDPPYCAPRYRRLCQGKGRHVACTFPTPGPGESCVNYTLVKFTKELRHFVTHYINRRRQRLAAGGERVRGGVHLPRPEVMMQVEWDRELALLAQRLADQCSFVHDDCRATVRFPYAGQTVGEVKWRHTSDSDTQNVARALRRVLDAWWGERRRVTVRQLTQPFRLNHRGSVWGHFSQLAVWTLRAVGCGAVRHGGRQPRLLLVCDFSHTNMLGQRTIVPGGPAPCPIHTARRVRSQYPMLCMPVRHQEIDESNDSERSYETGEDEIDHSDKDDENNISGNDTMPQEANEYTQPSIATRKQIGLNVQTTDDTTTTEDTMDNTTPQKEENKIKKMRNRVKPSINKEDETFQENFRHVDDRPYQIKRMRDRGKIRDKESMQRPSEKSVQIIEKFQDTDKTGENWFERVQSPSYNEELSRERPRPYERPETYETPERTLHFERKGHPDRQRPPGIEISPERGPHKKTLFENERLERVRPTERERLHDIDATGMEFEGQTSLNEAEIMTTSEIQKTRYMLKLSDIHEQQKQFVDFKNIRKEANDREDFKTDRDNLMDKINMEIEQENYKDELGGTTRYNRLQTAHSKHRFTEVHEQETTESIMDNTAFFDFRRPKTAAEPRGTQFYEAVGARHRWRPSKDRPERPGARALITNTNVFATRRPGAPKKNPSAIASITMDKDDVEQLFKDTGFNLGWKQHKKVLS